MKRRPWFALVLVGLVAGIAWWALSPRGLAPDAGAAVTLGERINAALDELMALGDRLLELPLFVLLAGVAVLAPLVAFVVARICGQRGRPVLLRAVGWTVITIAVTGLAVLADRRIARLQDEVASLRHREVAVPHTVQSGPVAPATTAGPAAAVALSPGAKLTIANLEHALAAHFPGAVVTSRFTSTDCDVVRVHCGDPLIEAFAAVVDLASPNVKVVIGGALDHKTLTSDFANGHGCAIAINGEAGESPARNALLGQWRGNLVVEGEVRLREDAAVPRPFLAFDRQNRAHFTAIGGTQRELSDSMYNVIWGRLDAVVDGVAATADERNRQPRTAMGIDAGGQHLYLLVIDGRQPRYSMGATRAEVGWMLQALGAHHGMLCDEGGSSCMYLQDRREVINIPSDFRGEERPTYTHFGVVF